MGYSRTGAGVRPAIAPPAEAPNLVQTQGFVTQSGLASLLETMEAERATGTLAVRRTNTSCTFFFLFGILFHATGDASQGEEAAIAALRWPDCSYTFDARARLPSDETIHRPARELAAEAQQREAAASSRLAPASPIATAGPFTARAADVAAADIAAAGRSDAGERAGAAREGVTRESVPRESEAASRIAASAGAPPSAGGSPPVPTPAVPPSPWEERLPRWQRATEAAAGTATGGSPVAPPERVPSQDESARRDADWGAPAARELPGEAHLTGTPSRGDDAGIARTPATPPDALAPARPGGVPPRARPAGPAAPAPVAHVAGSPFPTPAPARAQAARPLGAVAVATIPRLPPLPNGVPTYMGLRSSWIDLSKLLHSLESEGFTGYVRLRGADAAGAVLMQEGRTVDAMCRSADVLGGDDAVVELHRAVDRSEGIIDVVRLSPATVAALSGMLTGPLLYNALPCRFVNLYGLLAHLAEQKVSGAIVVSGGSETGVLLLDRGDLNGAYCDSSRDLKLNAGSTARLAAERAARLDVRAVGPREGAPLLQASGRTA